MYRVIKASPDGDYEIDNSLLHRSKKSTKLRSKSLTDAEIDVFVYRLQQNKDSLSDLLKLVGDAETRNPNDIQKQRLSQLRNELEELLK